MQRPDQPVLSVATLVAMAVSATVLIAYAWHFLPFISDDALISLRYSERLLAGDGLTWTAGERVEGYSNLLWVLAVAGVSPLVGGDLIVAARLLGVASMLAVIGALYRAYWPATARELVAPTVAALSFAASAPIAVWAIGGLEQALVAGLLAWSLALTVPLADVPVASSRSLLRAGLPLALLCITRPDGALFAFAIGLGLLAVRPKRWASVKLVVVLAILPLAFVGGQLAFRLAYYGEWVPNTAHAKVSVSAVHVHQGLRYVVGGARAMPVILAAAAVTLVLVFVRGRARRIGVLIIPFVVWPAYVMTIGGDIFPAYRHLIPLVVIAVFIVAEATAWLSTLGRRVSAGVVAFGLVPLTLVAGHRHPEVQRARDERWEWQGQVVGEMLQRAFGTRAPLLAVDSAGCLPYFSKLLALDLLGLNDRYLATHPPPGFGDGWLGHELGDGAYALRRKPDLVLLCGPLGPEPLGNDQGCFRSGIEMVATPQFHLDYAKVQFETGTLVGMIWVRRDGRVGVQREPGRIVIPGHLIAANPATRVRAAADGSLEAAVAAARPARLQQLAVTAGTWVIDARASGPLRIRIAAEGQLPIEGAPPLELAIAAPRDVTIEVTTAGPEIALAELVLRRR
ncbi:MAG: hypothetical protein WKG01_16880 [Kofleriaceae bacterium]